MALWWFTVVAAGSAACASAETPPKTCASWLLRLDAEERTSTENAATIALAKKLDFPPPHRCSSDLQRCPWPTARST
jgi:hypothetical protein